MAEEANSALIRSIQLLHIAKVGTFFAAPRCHIPSTIKNRWIQSKWPLSNGLQSRRRHHTAPQGERRLPTFRTMISLPKARQPSARPRQTSRASFPMSAKKDRKLSTMLDKKVKKPWTACAKLVTPSLLQWKIRSRRGPTQPPWRWLWPQGSSLVRLGAVKEELCVCRTGIRSSTNVHAAAWPQCGAFRLVRTELRSLADPT